MKRAKIVDTRITDKWGVDWTPMEIVRDFLQNFYDDNPVENIEIDIQGNMAKVTAPKAFDPNQLIYLGSDKGDSQIGQYGEGFKAATLNAIRNHGCGVAMCTGDKRLEFFFKPMRIGGRERLIVMCKIKPNAFR